MQSSKFTVNSDAERMAAARYATEDFAGKLELDRHSALRLDLMVEETLGMVKAMVDEFYGQLWFVGEGTACELHLEATTNMDADKKDELLSVSSTGRNAAAKGFMSLIGEIISGALRGFGRAMDAYGAETVKYGIVHTQSLTANAADDMVPIWTLQTYRSDLDNDKDADSEAWDELEKSIVAKLADDVIVGIKNDRIEMVIVKDFGK